MKLFGSTSRSKILTLVALLGETYPRQLARLSGAPLASVQRIVNALEREGAVASRIVGANREVRLNPRFYGADDLRALLLKYAKRDPLLERRVSELRRRPRRAGKALQDVADYADVLTRGRLLRGVHCAGDQRNRRGTHDQSKDADFIISFSIDMARAGDALRELGYDEVGGTYHHDRNLFTLEFPPGPLAIGNDLVTSYETVQRGSEILHRLASFYFFGDRVH